MKKIRSYTSVGDLAADIAREVTSQFPETGHVEFDYDRFEKPGDIRFMFILSGVEMEIYYSTLVERYTTVPEFVAAFFKQEATS